MQAGERTSHLFRLANLHNAIVRGYRRLERARSGLDDIRRRRPDVALHVNASLPKTLIRYLIRWVAESGQFGDGVNGALRFHSRHEISPELVPGTERERTELQSSEATIGPYALQDFNLYYITRFGFRPSKVAYLAHHAWRDREHGAWPELIPLDKRREYDLATIVKWLEVFLHRFFKTSQFKRSAMPNAPKVGSGGSLSPRGDWRAPSDSEAAIWLDELRRNVPASVSTSATHGGGDAY